MRKSGHVLLFRYSFHPVGIQCEDKLDNKLQAYIKLVIFINSFHTLDIQWSEANKQMWSTTIHEKTWDTRIKLFNHLVINVSASVN